MIQSLFNVYDVIVIISAYQCILFAYFFLSRRREPYKKYFWLGLFLLAYSSIFIEYLVFAIEPIHSWLQVNLSISLYVLGLGHWLVAPLLLFYVRSMIHKDYELNLHEVVFLAPCLAYILYLTGMSLFSEDFHLYQAGYEVSNSELILVSIREIFSLYCCYRCLTELRGFHKKIKDVYSEVSSIELNWLSIISYFFFSIILLGLVTLFIEAASYWSNVLIKPHTITLFSMLLTVFMLAALLIFSLGHSKVFDGLDKIDMKINEDSDEGNFSEDLVREIDEFIKTKKPYLDKSLSLKKLAESLEMSPRLLSNIINQKFNKNFFEYINYFRIEEAKLLLSNQESYKLGMLEIMESSGFNSKASFNEFFKRNVGQTPSHYRKHNRQT